MTKATTYKLMFEKKKKGTATKHIALLTHVAGFGFSHDALDVQLDADGQDEANPHALLDFRKLDHHLLLALLQIAGEPEVPVTGC